MKSIVLFFSILAFLQADVILVKSLACKEIETLEKIPADISQDYIKLNIYAMSNDCAFVSKKDKVQAHEYNYKNQNSLYTKIYLKDSGRILYIRSKNIQIEQPGNINAPVTFSR